MPQAGVVEFLWEGFPQPGANTASLPTRIEWAIRKHLGKTRGVDAVNLMMHRNGAASLETGRLLTWM